VSALSGRLRRPRDEVIGIIAFNFHSKSIKFTDVQVDFANKLTRSFPLPRERPVVRNAEGEREIRTWELGAMDHCIKPATTDKMDRSETCLRTHLEPLSRERMRGGGTGAAVRMNLHNFHVEARD
jgi:hypothetical protein